MSKFQTNSLPVQRRNPVKPLPLLCVKRYLCDRTDTYWKPKQVTFYQAQYLIPVYLNLSMESYRVGKGNEITKAAVGRKTSHGIHNTQKSPVVTEVSKLHIESGECEWAGHKLLL